MTFSDACNAHLDFKCHIITLNGDFVPLTARHVFYLFIFLWSSDTQLTRSLGGFNFDKWVKRGSNIKVVEMFNFCRVVSFILWLCSAGTESNKKKKKTKDEET